MGAVIIDQWRFLNDCFSKIMSHSLTPCLSVYVKVCQMPALYLRTVGTRQNSGGRRSDKPRERKPWDCSDESGLTTVYGDLNGGSA
jgi:hypothetical protein